MPENEFHPPAKEAQAKGLTLGLVIRFLIYLISPVILLEIYVQFAVAGYAHCLARENHVMEWLEFGWLMLMAVMLFLAGLKHVDQRWLFHTLLLLPLIGGVRELDDVFEELLFDKAWIVVAGMLAVWFLASVFRRRKEFSSQAKALVRSRAFAFLISGLLVFAFSQVFGQQVLWKAVMGEDYVRDAKRIIEETCELLAYALLLIGSLECWLQESVQPPP